MGIALLLCAMSSLADAAAKETRLCPKGPPPADVIDLVDIADASLDTKLAATTLLGHVNKGPHARAALLLRDTEVFPDRFWLDDLRTRGYVKTFTEISTDEYFAKCAPCATKAIVYDPDLPATMNIATMIASLEDGMAVAPDDLALHGQGRDVVDLRGRWATNVAAYEWAYQELWPRMNHSVLACYHPTHANHHIRDYLVSHRIFTFWATGADAADGITSDHAAERAFAEKVMAATADNVPVLGWWGATDDPGLTEYAGVSLAGEYGKLTVPCDWGTNLTLFSGVPARLPRAIKRYHDRPKPSTPPLDPSKVYVCFAVVESGDSPPYWQAIQKRVWDDPARGTVPIAWSFGPVLADLYPSIAEWFLENATGNDHLVVGLSGAGYVHPYRGLFSRSKDADAAWIAYLDLTSAYMNRFGLRHLCLYTDAWRPYDRAAHDATTRRFVQGVDGLDSLIMGMGRDDDITEKTPNYFLDDGNVLVSHVFTRWDAQNVGRNPENNEWMVDEIESQTPATRPAFMYVSPLSWSYHPSDLCDVLKELGGDYVAVSPDAFRSLYRASLNAPRPAASPQ
ncbi:MAG: hypothetical protein GY851_05785 [bacterium]|nr:hypothetical protein [bacterium]